LDNHLFYFHRFANLDENFSNLLCHNCKRECSIFQASKEMWKDVPNEIKVSFHIRKMNPKDYDINKSCEEVDKKRLIFICPNCVKIQDEG